MDAMTLSEASERASRGARHLDSVRPGWHDQINLRELNLAAGNDCVVGQLTGWFSASNEIFTTPERSVSHGVLLATDRAMSGADFMLVMIDYSQLTVAWKELVLQRRAAVADLVLCA